MRLESDEYTPNGNMIQTTNLTKYYGTHCAVNSINLRVTPGEIVGLLGPNGAGKSTTMRMITGYLRPTAGSVLIDNKDLEESPIESKRLIGYLPEFAPLYPEMMVHDYLRFMATVRMVERKSVSDEIDRVAELCGLNSMMHKGFTQLSRGYKQRVGLAHAIIGDPAILVLDEPTSGLDPNQIVEIRSLIKDIGKEKAVIFSTHVLIEAEATCDRIVIIHNGDIVADSTPQELKQSLQGLNTLTLTLEHADFTSVESAFASIQGVAEVTRIGGGPTTAVKSSIQLRVVCDESARRALNQRIKSEDWILLELNVERQSMEDVFRELTEYGGIKGKVDGA